MTPKPNLYSCNFKGIYNDIEYTGKKYNFQIVKVLQKNNEYAYKIKILTNLSIKQEEYFMRNILNDVKEITA
jgi:hypothetical protein